MKRATLAVAATVVGLTLSGVCNLGAQQPNGVPASTMILKTDASFDKRTQIRPSTIPGAGNGLFAITRIAKGETIGELGGRLITDAEYRSGSMKDNHYIASIAECAWGISHPYTSIDAREHGAPTSRINTAPWQINGVSTGFQNAELTRLCKPPYVIFVAVRDIEPGEEIWASYGSGYDYERFMYIPAVRDFFCGLIKIDCKEVYSYEF